MSMIEELNSLCKIYVSKKESFEHKSKIRQILNDLIQEGYNISAPQFDQTSEEFDRLSDIGKLIWNRMMITKNKKLEAIKKGHLEFAKDLNFLERGLQKRVECDFSYAISNRFFFLKSEELKKIIYNDSEGTLKEFIPLF